MKQKLFILAIISVFSFGSFAQKLTVGFKGGASINKLSGQSFKDQFSFGYHLGGMAGIGIGKRLGIQTEILFNQINVDTANNISDIYHFDNVGKAQLKYLSIPILLNIKPVKFITLQVGPQFGILINRSETFVENGRNAFKMGDLSMLGGVQLNVSHFLVYGRYAVGLNNLNDIDSQDKWKSQSIQVGVGLKL